MCVCVCLQVCVFVWFHMSLLEKSGAGGGVSVCWGVGGYSLVMLTAFYKLWLTLLPTAD